MKMTMEVESMEVELVWSGDLSAAFWGGACPIAFIRAAARRFKVAAAINKYTTEMPTYLWPKIRGLSWRT